jgi:hypothetical protein
MKIRSLISRVFGKRLKRILRSIWRLQFRNIVSQEDLHFLAASSTFSEKATSWDTRFNSGIGGWWAVSNHSQGFHGLLVQYWEYYGLGKTCLLVSENQIVKEQFIERYHETSFICADYYTDLYNVASKPDVVWNLYENPPSQLANNTVDSVVCQATFEHLMDPVGVMRRLASLCNPEGHIYIHTHTPGYNYHPCPRDYIRLFPEWFMDIPQILNNLEIVELYASDGHVFVVFKVK